MTDDNVHADRLAEGLAVLVVLALLAVALIIVGFTLDALWQYIIDPYLDAWIMFILAVCGLLIVAYIIGTIAEYVAPADEE